MFKTTVFMILSTIIVAHRGGAKIANENTLSSFQQAIEMGVDMVEIDLKQMWSILGEIIGETYTDELIDQLFSQFCLGK